MWLQLTCSRSCRPPTSPTATSLFPWIFLLHMVSIPSRNHPSRSPTIPHMASIPFPSSSALDATITAQYSSPLRWLFLHFPCLFKPATILQFLTNSPSQNLQVHTSTRNHKFSLLWAPPSFSLHPNAHAFLPCFSASPPLAAAVTNPATKAVTPSVSFISYLQTQLTNQSNHILTL